MPIGVHLPNMMDNEVVQCMHACLTNLDSTMNGNINFEKVAIILGLKDANAAKGRLARVMKAQQKAVPGLGHGKRAPKNGVTKAGGTKGRKPKAAVANNDNDTSDGGVDNNGKGGAEVEDATGDDVNVGDGIKAESGEGAGDADVNGEDTNEA